MQELETVSLASLAAGAAGELFDAELAKVLENIADYSTPAGTKRRIVLTLDLKPNDERGLADVAITCTSKLAPLAHASARYYFGMRDGRRAAVVEDPKQPGLFDKPGGKVVPMGDKRED